MPRRNYVKQRSSTEPDDAKLTLLFGNSCWTFLSVLLGFRLRRVATQKKQWLRLTISNTRVIWHSQY